MAYTLGEAAKAVGKTKAAIWQALAANRISAVKDDKNRWQIEPAELFKIYPPLQQAKRQNLHGDLPPDYAVLQVKVELLEKLCKQMEGERDRLHEQVNRLGGLLSADKALQLENWQRRAPTVIDMPPTHPPAPTEAVEPRRRWFRFGSR